MNPCTPGSASAAKTKWSRANGIDRAAFDVASRRRAETKKRRARERSEHVCVCVSPRVGRANARTPDAGLPAVTERRPERDDTRITEVISRCASDSARGNAFARAAGRASERRRDHRVRAGSREIRVGAGAGFVETRGDGVLREP